MSNNADSSYEKWKQTERDRTLAITLELLSKLGVRASEWKEKGGIPPEALKTILHQFNKMHFVSYHEAHQGWLGRKRFFPPDMVVNALQEIIDQKRTKHQVTIRRNHLLESWIPFTRQDLKHFVELEREKFGTEAEVRPLLFWDPGLTIPELYHIFGANAKKQPYFEKGIAPYLRSDFWKEWPAKQGWRLISLNPRFEDIREVNSRTRDGAIMRIGDGRYECASLHTIATATFLNRLFNPGEDPFLHTIMHWGNVEDSEGNDVCFGFDNLSGYSVRVAQSLDHFAIQKYLRTFIARKYPTITIV